MRVLVACEYSGRVRDAFLAQGHDAISCDLLPTDLPGPHYQGDVFDIINDRFDLLIAHPPCTFLTTAAEWAFDDVPMINGKPRKMKQGTLIGAERREARLAALDFVDRLWKSKIRRKCIENPVGIICRELPHISRPQYIQQYWFGEDASKKTGLHLDGLPRLRPTDPVDPRWVCCGETLDIDHVGKYGCPHCHGENKPLPRWGNQTNSGQNNLPPSADRWKIRSETPQGVADAMAAQWGKNEPKRLQSKRIHRPKRGETDAK